MRTREGPRQRAFRALQLAGFALLGLVLAGIVACGGDVGEARQIRAVLADDEASPERVRRAAARLLASPPGLFSEAERQDAVSRLPPTAPEWSAVGLPISELPADRFRVLLQRLRFEHADPEVRGLALASLTAAYRDQDDGASWRILHDELREYDNVSPLLADLIRELEPELRVIPGRRVPAFAAPLLDSPTETISDRDLRGAFVLIDFWATWCEPCIAEMPHLHDAWERFGGEGFQILSISFDESATAARAFREGPWSMPWLHAWEPTGFESELARSFEVGSLPEPILVTPRGEIVATYGRLRGEGLIAELELALGRQESDF